MNQAQPVSYLWRRCVMHLLFNTVPLAAPQGIKRIKPDQMTTCGPVLGEERSSEEFFDSLDHVIDIHGHIIGMGLSPDHRSDTAAQVDVDDVWNK